MAVVLDESTRAEYLAQALASSRASGIVSALGSTVYCEVYDGANVLRASGTMASPWATASGSTITVGEVTNAGIIVSAGGVPDSLWYAQFRGSNGRFVRGTFGVSGSGMDFTWNQSTFQTGSRGTLGTVTFATSGNPDGTGGPTVNITTFQVTSATTGTLPWAFGHAFKQGDVPSGYSVVTPDSMDFQATPTTYWPDGSVKHAIIAGRSVFSSAGTVTVNIGRGTAATGATLGISDLKASIPASTSITVGGTTMTLSGTTLDSPQRTVVTGPVMSNWLYRLPVAGNNHVVIWADVRLYKGGTVEIFPWVENGYLTVANPTNVTATCSVTMGGTSRFSQSIDIKHHTRIPLVTGTTFSYWSSDPQITPVHNVAYLQSTKLVPNYGVATVTSAMLNAAQQTYTPNTLAGVTAAMGTAGNTASLLRTEQAYYIASSADARAYRAMLVFGLSSGSWSCHYRDNATNEPFKFSDYPNASINVQGSPAIPVGSGPTNGEWIATHLPTYGYLPWLVTGRWWFLDEQLFWTTALYLSASTDQRAGGGTGFSGSPVDFIIDPRRGAWANRGAHWALRTLAQTLAIIPSSHPCYASHLNAWEKNTSFYDGCFVSGTLQSGTWVSAMGWLGEFSEDGNSLYSSRVSGAGGTPGDQWWGAAYMSAYGVQAWANAWDLGLPQSSASRTRHQGIRDQAYKQVVLRAGDGSSGTWNWQRFAAYDVPIGSDATGSPPDTWYTAGQSYTAFCAGYGLSTSPGGSYLTQRYSNAQLVNNDQSDVHYLGISLVGLAYAVDHGYTGASAGWSRITGASNWSTVRGYLDVEFAVSPRSAVPDWVQSLSTLTWYAIPNSQLSSAQTGMPTITAVGGGLVGTASGVVAYSGATMKSSGAEVFLFGGGHGDWAGNEVYSIRLADSSPVWTRRTEPSTSVRQDVAYYDDGKPSSRHTYSSLQYIDSRDRMFVFGSYSVYGTGGGAFNKVDAFNPTTNTWAAAGTYADGTGLNVADLGYCRDTSGNVYAHCVSPYDAAGRFMRWNVASATWTNLAAAGNVIIDGEILALCYDATRNRVMSFGFPRGWYDPTTGAFTQVTLSGTRASTVNARGIGTSWVYCPDRDSYIGWIRGQNVVYECNASTFSVSELTLSGSAPPAAYYGNAYDKLYNRLMYSSELKLLVFVVGHTLNVYCFKVA